MKALLDTHASLSWLAGDRSLSRKAIHHIANEQGDVLVSAASAWKIATKHRLGKLPRAGDVAVEVAGCIDAQSFQPLPATVAHVQRAGAWPDSDRDPFDRMLVAQAILEDCVLVSNESIFDRCDVARLW